MLYTRLNDLPHARLGVVVAKRFAPRAVTRNTIKRVTRELFRQTGLPAIDCLVRLAKPVNSKQGPATTAKLKTDLRVELARIFAQAKAAKSHPRQPPLLPPTVPPTVPPALPSAPASPAVVTSTATP